MSGEREARALAVMAAAGIELENSKPGGTRRWFAGPESPTIEGVSELERVAYYVGLAMVDPMKLIDNLDGYGLVVTDDEPLIERLAELGYNVEAAEQTA